MKARFGIVCFLILTTIMAGILPAVAVESASPLESRAPTRSHKPDTGAETLAASERDGTTNRTVAFLYGGNLWTVREDGTDISLLTDTGQVHAFAWSPDGLQIAFTAGGTNLEGDIYVVNADGSNTRRLTHGIRASRLVIDWHGSRIAFIRDTSSYDPYYPTVRIAVVDLSDPNLTVTDLSPDIVNWGMGIDPLCWPRMSWSPDGQWIVLSHGSAKGVQSSDGTVFRELDIPLINPRWRNDSAVLVYTDRTGILTYDPAQDAHGMLSSADAHVAAHSPDDHYVAYADDYYLRRMNADDSSHIVLAYRRATDLRWSPEGDRIVYVGWYRDFHGYIVYDGLHFVNWDGSGEKQLYAGEIREPRWQPQIAGFARDVSDFVSASRECITDAADAAQDIAVVGDYFLDKQDADLARWVINLSLNTIDLLGVNWNLVGRELNHIVTPGYEAALHASWRGWMDDRIAKHWYKPVYDAIRNDRELLFSETAWAGLKYYAREAGIEALKGPITDWLLATLVPGPTTPVWDQFGLPAFSLGASYSDDLARELDELLLVLPGLGLTPEEQEAYRADLLARQQAHAHILSQLEGQRDFLWSSYQDALADEANWWRFWGPLLTKWVVVGAATVAWDGPGFYVASAGYNTFDLIYDAVQDTRSLAHDGKMLDQSERFLWGRTSVAYGQIAFNTVDAFNAIRAGDPPQIADADLAATEMKSFGHYRLWPSLWWAEESSQAELSIQNHSPFTVTCLTSAAYTHTTFWAGAEQLWPEGESLDLAASGYDTAAIKFKMGDIGVSPDRDSRVDLLILGATGTALYPVTKTHVMWDPVRVETATGTLASAPAGFDPIAAQLAPALPYPLAALVGTPPGSMDHQVTIAAINPFTFTVAATVSQTVPLTFTILDAGDGLLINDTLVWTDVISAGAGIELRALLGWQDEPGSTAVLPGAILAFEDPQTGQGDTYTTTDKIVRAAWPLDVKADLPLTWPAWVTVSIPVTLTNISDQVTAQGVFTFTASAAGGRTLQRSVFDLNLAPHETQMVLVPLHVKHVGYVVLRGEVTLGSVHRTEFLELVTPEGRVYLPLIPKGN